MTASIWIPIIISGAGVGIVLLSNAFFFGGKLESKADKKDVEEKLNKKVDVTVYCEDKKVINEKINERVRKEVLDIHMRQFKESYGAVEDRLFDIEEKQDAATELNAENYRLVTNKLTEITTLMTDIKEKLK